MNSVFKDILSQLQSVPILDYPQKNFPKTYFDYFLECYNFSQKYNFAIFDAGLNAFQTLFSLQDKPTKAKKIKNIVRTSFDYNLRKSFEEEKFADALGKYIESFSEMINLTRHNLVHAYFENTFASLNVFVEPFRDSINRTPSEIIKMEGKFDLLHYKSTIPIKHKTPILIVGSLINRYYILDLLPKISIIQKLQKEGFDVYATDWRTPNSFDKDMTLDNYAHEYVEKAVDKVREVSGSDKVSLFGYCWGGIFSLIQSAIHPQKIKNLILHATPTDLEKDPTSIEIWTKKINADQLVKVFGNIPGHFLNIAFLMRNPIDAALKYPRFFSEARTIDELTEFFAVEWWLYDSRPIIGEVFRKIVDDVYKKNLLIKSEMKVGGKTVVLKNITMPCLNIVGEYDDLVPPQSSRTITNVIASQDKQLMEFPTGHVGLCISASAHEKLWPNVVKWISERS